MLKILSQISMLKFPKIQDLAPIVHFHINGSSLGYNSVNVIIGRVMVELFIIEF